MRIQPPAECRPNDACHAAWVARAVAFVASAVLALTALGGQDGDYERWYVVEMMGQRAGWAMQTQETEADQITSRSTMRFEIRRGEIAVTVSMEGDFVETVDGEPVSMSLSQRFGAAPTRVTARFTGDAVEVTEHGPGGEKRVQHPLPDGVWLTPAAAASYVRQRLAAGADRIEVRTIEPTGGITVTEALRPVTITRTELKPVTIKAMGKDVTATRCLSVSSAQPSVKATEWLDEAGIPIRIETALGGISIAMVAADRTEATARVAAPELMIRTFVRPEGVMPPRDARRAAYLLSSEEGQLPEIPSTTVQSVHRTGAGSARVVINLDAPAVEAKIDRRPYLADSPMISPEDDRIRELRDRAVGADGADPAARAEAMRRFVHRYIRNKGLEVGFAGSAEVARTRAGDCTEHAVLLAAMLRADGIPSRVAAGLVYADEFVGERGVFAYHMWTQALLEDGDKVRWVDVDGTLPDDRPMDVTHLALAVSPLGNEHVHDVFVSLASMLGRLSIAVEAEPAR